MTVKELIQKLSLYDDDTPVFTYHYDDWALGSGHYYNDPRPELYNGDEEMEDQPHDGPFIVI